MLDLREGPGLCVCGGGFLSTGRRRKPPEDVWEALLSLGGKEGGHQGWQQEDQQSRQLPKPEHCLLFPERLSHEPRAFKGGAIVNAVSDYQ